MELEERIPYLVSAATLAKEFLWRNQLLVKVCSKGRRHATVRLLFILAFRMRLVRFLNQWEIYGRGFIFL